VAAPGSIWSSETWKGRLIGFLTANGSPVSLRRARVDSATGTQAGESATFSVFHRFTPSDDRVRLREGSRYRQGRWIGRSMGLEELTFSHPVLRELAILAFERNEAEVKAARSAATTSGRKT
jgi:hypothetical protein